MSDSCSVLWLKQGRDGCSWCPVQCADSTRTIRPLETKLAGVCCFHIYFVDCSGDIISPPDGSFAAQAKDLDGDLFWAAVDSGFTRGTDAAGDDYLELCLNANTQAIRQAFVDVHGKCCTPKGGDDKLFLTLEIGWQVENVWTATCDIHWCIAEAVIDPDEPFTSIPPSEVCQRVASCFGGLTSPDDSITISGNFSDGFEIESVGGASGCLPFTVNAGTTANITDDSLGTATLACGETLHFVDTEGRITVSNGSAIVDLSYPETLTSLSTVNGSLVYIDEEGNVNTIDPIQDFKDSFSLDCSGLPVT